MPETDLPAGDIRLLCDALYKDIQKLGVLSFGYYNDQGNKENKRQLKRNAKLKVETHISFADWEYLFHCLEEYPGVVRKQGSGYKDVILCYRPKELNLNIRQIAQPTKAQREEMANTMIAVIHEHLGKGRLLIADMKNIATQRLGFTFAAKPVHNWGPTFTMIYTEKNQIRKLGGGYVINFADLHTEKMAAQAQEKPAQAKERKKPGPKTKLEASGAPPKSTATGTLTITVRPDGGIEVTAPEGFTIQISSPDPKVAMLLEMSSVQLALVHQK